MQVCGRQMPPLPLSSCTIHQTWAIWRDKESIRAAPTVDVLQQGSGNGNKHIYYIYDSVCYTRTLLSRTVATGIVLDMK